MEFEAHRDDGKRIAESAVPQEDMRNTKVITSGDYVWTNRSRWPCGLRRGSTDARLLGSRIRIPLRALMFVVLVVCCVGSGLCDGLVRLLVQRSPTGCAYLCVV
jgi:hypothetical protein